MRAPRRAAAPPVSRVDAARDEVEEKRRAREGIGLVQRAADAADEVHEDEVGAPPADLEAEREGAVGIEGEGHRGLTDLAALAAPA